MLRTTLLLAALLLIAVVPTPAQDSSFCDQFEGMRYIDVIRARHDRGYWTGYFLRPRNTYEQHLFVASKDDTNTVYVVVFPLHADPFESFVQDCRLTDWSAAKAGIEPTYDYMVDDQIKEYDETYSSD